MKTSKPFTFILHVITRNHLVTNVTVIGIAYQSVNESRSIESIGFSIDELVVESDSINIASCLDIQQLNNACFNYAKQLFAEETIVASPGLSRHITSLSTTAIIAN